MPRRKSSSDGPDPVDREVGVRLRLARRARGATLQSLAATLGLTAQQIQKYELGLNRVSASTLVALAEALDVAPASLLPSSTAEVLRFDVELAHRSALQEAAAALMRIEPLSLRRQLLGLIHSLASRPAGGAEPSATPDASEAPA
jgi:transcriptional regulator with XRE-family HTH domain